MTPFWSASAGGCQFTDSVVALKASKAKSSGGALGTTYTKKKRREHLNAYGGNRGGCNP